MGECPIFEDDYVCTRDPGWLLPPPKTLILDEKLFEGETFDVWSEGLKQTVYGLGTTLGVLLFAILFTGLVCLIYLFIYYTYVHTVYTHISIFYYNISYFNIYIFFRLVFLIRRFRERVLGCLRRYGPLKERRNQPERMSMNEMPAAGDDTHPQTNHNTPHLTTNQPNNKQNERPKEIDGTKHKANVLKHKRVAPPPPSTPLVDVLIHNQPTAETSQASYKAIKTPTLQLRPLKPNTNPIDPGKTNWSDTNSPTAVKTTWIDVNALANEFDEFPKGAAHTPVTQHAINNLDANVAGDSLGANVANVKVERVTTKTPSRNAENGSAMFAEGAGVANMSPPPPPPSSPAQLNTKLAIDLDMSSYTASLSKKKQYLDLDNGIMSGLGSPISKHTRSKKPQETVNPTQENVI